MNRGHRGGFWTPPDPPQFYQHSYQFRFPTPDPPRKPAPDDPPSRKVISDPPTLVSEIRKVRICNLSLWEPPLTLVFGNNTYLCLKPTVTAFFPHQITIISYLNTAPYFLSLPLQNFAKLHIWSTETSFFPHTTEKKSGIPERNHWKPSNRTPKNDVCWAPQYTTFIGHHNSLNYENLPTFAQ